MMRSRPLRFTPRTTSIAFAVHRNPGCPPSRPHRTNARTRVALVFDSFATLTAGVRSAAHCQRHLLYRAEPYELDLLLELHPESHRLVVTGQLLDSSRPEIFRRGVRITLWNFRQSFVTLRTNEWGEFWGEIEDSAELMVSLKVQTREIAVSIRHALHRPALDS
jgi:hypothetical protein